MMNLELPVVDCAERTVWSDGLGQLEIKPALLQQGRSNFIMPGC